MSLKEYNKNQNFVQTNKSDFSMEENCQKAVFMLPLYNYSHLLHSGTHGNSLENETNTNEKSSFEWEKGTSSSDIYYTKNNTNQTVKENKNYPSIERLYEVNDIP